MTRRPSHFIPPGHSALWSQQIDGISLFKGDYLYKKTHPFTPQSERSPYMVAHGAGLRVVGPIALSRRRGHAGVSSVATVSESI